MNQSAARIERGERQRKPAKAITSRLNQDLRQPRNARQALSGWPRCSDAMPSATALTPSATDESNLADGANTAATLAPTASCVSTSMNTSGQCAGAGDTRA